MTQPTYKVRLQQKLNRMRYGVQPKNRARREIREDKMWVMQASIDCFIDIWEQEFEETLKRVCSNMKQEELNSIKNDA